MSSVSLGNGDTDLPTSTDMVHPGRRYRRWRARHRQTISRVDDGDGIAGSRCGRLVQLEI